MDSLAHLRIAIYARFSSDNQRDSSIDDQVRLCREHAKRLGGVISDDLVFADHAISGAVKERPAFERLFRLVESRAVDVVITESGDRLSRDLGDADRAWKLIDYHRVRLICVSDGIDSVSDGARMQFRFKAIFADEFLVDLGKKTRRGQLGAADRGYCTGGLPYGYSSRAIWDGGREPKGFEIVIDDEQAQTVVRIFELYREGHSLLGIAKHLNDAGVPPPRAASKKRASAFWRKTTLREMLSNRAYIGQWTYGRKHWRKDPTTRKRRYTKRAEQDVFVSERPHLRIIPQPLWVSVEERRKAVYENYAGKGHGAPGRRTAHPFAGLLHCGLCGHRMSDGGGSRSRYYRCSAAMTGGICTNRQPVREDALLEVALAEMKRVLFATDLQVKMRHRIEQRLRSFKIEHGREREQAERELQRVESEVARLVTFIRTTDVAASPGIVEAVRGPLEEATRKQQTLKRRLDALSREAAEPRAPTVEEIVELVRDVEARIKEDPTSAREALRQLLLNGRITMTPNPDGSYQAESMLVLGRVAWKTRKPRSAVAAGASSDSSVVGIDGCAGWN